MPNKVIKLISAVLIITIIFSAPLGSFASKASTEPTKDETVYLLLDYSGKISDTIVVNSIRAAGDSYTDYGDYTNVLNLTNGNQPTIEGDKLVFGSLPENAAFYYRGNLKNAQNPWNIGIKYYLEGTEVGGEQLAGAKGNIEIKISVSPAKDSGNFADLFSLQVQAVLTKGVKSVKADGASIVTLGSYHNVATMIMPGASSKISINVDADGFEMQPITFSGVKADIDIENLGQIGGGFGDMKISDIKQKAEEAKSGVDQITAGLSELNEGIKQGAAGLTNLTHAAGQIIGGAKPFKDALSQYNEGISGLSIQAANLPKGTQQLKTAIENANAQFAPLAEYAAALSQGEDQQIAALAKAFLGMMKMNESAVAGLTEINKGETAITEGIAQLAAGFGSVKTGGEQYADGALQFASGARTAASKFTALPDGAAKLLEGQEQFAKGIGSAKDQIDQLLASFDKNKDAKVVSFTSAKNKVSTVQFVMRTPEIRKEEPEKAPLPRKQKKGVLEKLMDLFK